MKWSRTMGLEFIADATVVGPSRHKPFNKECTMPRQLPKQIHISLHLKEAARRKRSRRITVADPQLRVLLAIKRKLHAALREQDVREIVID
jgi:hypothetical protein